MYSQEFYRFLNNFKMNEKKKRKDSNRSDVAVRLVTGSDILLPRMTRKHCPVKTLQIRIFPSAQPVKIRRYINSRHKTSLK